MTSADVLLRATSFARSLRGRVMVVKLGGSALEDATATAGTLASIAALQTLGVRIVVVHGGGKPIDRAMAAAGLTPKKVAGRRYTDQATLAIVAQVLREEINPQVVGGLEAAGAQAQAVTDALIFPLSGDKLLLVGEDLVPIDLGYVGRPTNVDAAYLSDFLDSGIIPVVPSLCLSGDGGWLNVNADTAAAAIAGAFQAHSAVFLTDTPGVLADPANLASVIARLTTAEAKARIASGAISGGMIPKVEACFEALAAGAEQAVILDGRQPHALLADAVGEPLPGTVLVP